MFFGIMCRFGAKCLCSFGFECIYLDYIVVLEEHVTHRVSNTKETRQSFVNYHGHTKSFSYNHELSVRLRRRVHGGIFSLRLMSI